MKTLFQINRALFIGTLLLYLTIYFGLIAQVVLGAFQVLAALYLAFHLSSLSSRTKQLLLTYWVVTTVYLSLLFSGFYNSSNDAINILFFAVIPMGLASLFLYINFKAYKEYQIVAL